MHDHCHHHHTGEHLRRGSRLEDGTAHTLDHLRWSRRDFMAQMGLASLGTSFMLGGRPITAFGHTPTLHALQQAETERVLVIIQLNGGNDALNTIVPYEIDEYYRVRPTIAVPQGQVLRLENDHGLNPSMQSMMQLWNDNALAVVLNTGYNNSTRSHFEGTVNWATGSGRVEGQNIVKNTGVWGRYLEGVIGAMGGILDHPLAVRIGGPVSLFQSGLGNLGISLGDSQFIEEIARRGFFDAQDPRIQGKPYGRPLSFVRAVANAALQFVGAVQRAAQDGTNLAGNYPGGFGGNLSAAARLIRGGLDARVISVAIGGFDTHSNQGSTEGNHADRWREIADAVAAFYQDLAVDGLDDKVLTMTFSEFGRTLGENGSRGTDHGAGASMMLYGPGLNRGVYGSQSDLITQLYGGDPAPSTDYRAVYATILEKWFGLDGGTVDGLLEASFPRMNFLPEYNETGGGLRMGDVTGNGDVSALDASRVLEHVAGLAPLEGAPFQVADVSGNGEISALDASYILEQVAGLRECLPAEPGCAEPGKGAGLAESASIDWEHVRIPQGAERLDVPLRLQARGGVRGFTLDLKVNPGRVACDDLRIDLPDDWTMVLNHEGHRIRLAMAGISPISEGVFTLSMRLHEGDGHAWVVGEARVNENAPVPLREFRFQDEVPAAFDLDQNYPNPFNPSTQIRYALTEGGPVDLRVFDMQGRLVRTLVSERKDAGAYTVTFEAGHLASGTYVYRLKTPEGVLSRTMMLVK